MKVGEIVTFTLPSSKKKVAGKIVQIRDKSVIVQTKDGKKVISKSLLEKKSKVMSGRAKDGSKCYTRTNNNGEKYITCEGTQKKVAPAPAPAPAPEPKKKVEPKKKANKTYLVKIDGEKDRKLTLSLLKQFINKRFGKKLTPSQEKKIDFMANVTIPGKKVGHFIIDGELIYTSKSGMSEINNQIVGKVDMGEKRKITLSEEQKKDKQLEKEKKEKEEDQKVKEHNEKYGKMEDLEDLWEKLKDLKWSAYDRREIERYIKDINIEGPAYSSTTYTPTLGVKAEVIQKGKRPVIKVLRVYYSKLTATTARPGKFKKEDFEFPEEEKKEPPSQSIKKKVEPKKKKSKAPSESDEQIKFLRELRARGLSEAEMMKEFEKKFG